MVFYPKSDILHPMPLIILKRLAVATLFIALTAHSVRANVDANPYATIADRNPFALKPPPPPPPPPEQTAPPVPMAKVTLTGLISMFGEPRALFEIIEEPAKGAANAKKPILREGEREGPVEVLAIDVAKNSVRIRNSGVETNMTFEVVKSGPTPGGAGVPGAPPAFTSAALNPAQPQPGSPTVISANYGGPGGGGVTLVGGNASPMSNPSSAAGVPGALGASSGAGAFPNVPPRPLRTETAAAAASGPPLTREQADLLIELNNIKDQERGAPPVPATALRPFIEGAQQEAASPFPPLPSSRGLRPPGR